MQIELMILTLIPYSLCVSIDDYCKKSQDNIPCRDRCVVSLDCGPNNSGGSKDMTWYRQDILNLHNNFRQKVASGKLSENHLKAASDMNVLSYDNEAEYFAECYAKLCRFEKDAVLIALDGTKMHAHGATVNNKFTQFKMGKHLIEHMFSIWTEERINMTEKRFGQLVESVSPNTVKSVEHLVALVWATTKFVGCSMMRSFQDQPHYQTFVFVCVYRPTSLQMNKKMYTPGDATSGTNNLFPNLIGKIRSMKDDKFQRPKNRANSTFGSVEVVSVLLICYGIHSRD